LLVAATERLLQCVRREDSIARLGGDEFTVLLEDMHDPSDAARLAERIGEALRTPFQLAGQQVNISSSIGIAVDTDRSHQPDDLLREADMAMYRAKSAGKACYEIFDTRTGMRATERLELETELRHAAQRAELVLKYESIVDLTSGRIDAVEALLRWQHPRRGLLDAAEFLQVAEESGIIVELGRWAVHQACNDAVRGRGTNVVQVQLSTRELAQPGLLESISASLAETGLAPERLRLAVPESALATDAEATAATLDAVQNLGVRLALTHVGGGPSSLAWLSRVPVETLVLAASTLESESLMRAYRALGATLDMKVAANTADRLRTRRHGVLVA
jgi:predicted signal transduction protein with EAL and GGDEF domain